MVITPDWEAVGFEFKYSIFWFFCKENPKLISVILNTKNGKKQMLFFDIASRVVLQFINTVNIKG